jgi:DNA-binding NtrC family response regulator
LETHQFRVLTARNGKEALGVYETASNPVTLVISDVVMPEMGGVELYQELTARQAGLRFLFMTGHPLEEENLALLKAERVNWLEKPFSVNHFIETVLGLLK